MSHGICLGQKSASKHPEIDEIHERVWFDYCAWSKRSLPLNDRRYSQSIEWYYNRWLGNYHWWWFTHTYVQRCCVRCWFRNCCISISNRWSFNANSRICESDVQRRYEKLHGFPWCCTCNASANATPIRRRECVPRTRYRSSHWYINSWSSLYVYRLDGWNESESIYLYFRRCYLNRIIRDCEKSYPNHDWQRNGQQKSSVTRLDW